MSKLSPICLLLLIIYNLSNLSSVKSTQNHSEFAEHRIQKRVVGGWFTEKYQNTVFKLVFDSRSTCTGTFIAPNAILTAAHCCKNVNSSSVSYFLRPYTIIINVTILKYHFHPNYKFSVTNFDIVIIELTKNESIIPATLDYSRVELDETVWMHGYGLTDANQTEHTFRLKEFPALVADLPNCTRYFPYFPYSFCEMIHTSTTNGSTCSGDSGGPMFNQKGALVGVHSGGSKNCSTGQLNMAVRISSHKHFIQTVLHQISSSDFKNSSNTLHFNSLYFFILITFYFIF